MKKFTFRGLMAPVFTPFNDDSSQSINTKIILDYSTYLSKKHISGILVNGTTGEGPSMTVEERESVTEAWSKACKCNNQCLMVQVGGAALPDVLRMAKHAEQNDVDALLCLPDLFNSPKTSSELIDYLNLVSSAAPKTPLLYYHLPSWTSVNINMNEFLNDAYGKIPTLVGIKFTSTKLDEGAACITAKDNFYTIFLGADQILAGAVTLGFDSAIATTLNIIPEESQAILKEMKENNVKLAQTHQKALNNFIDFISSTQKDSWVTTMKNAFNIITQIQVGNVRPPLKTLNEDQVKQMNINLNQLGYLE